MKKVFLCLVLILILICIPTLASANNGKAIIPSLEWYSLSSSYQCLPFIFFSNITADQINIKLTIINSDGSILRSYLTTDSNTISNFSTNVSDASVSFTLNAYTTGRVFFSIPVGGTTKINYGYGNIFWSSNNYLNTTPGVTAKVNSLVVDAGITWGISDLVNNGLPF